MDTWIVFKFSFRTSQVTAMKIVPKQYPIVSILQHLPQLEQYHIDVNICWECPNVLNSFWWSNKLHEWTITEVTKFIGTTRKSIDEFNHWLGRPFFDPSLTSLAPMKLNFYCRAVINALFIAIACRFSYFTHAICCIPRIPPTTQSHIKHLPHTVE